MSQSTLSRELALRIGLAARALPDTQSKQLVHVLTDLLGWPLTEAKLAKLTLEPYRQALNRSYTNAILKESLSFLTNADQSNADEMTSSQIQFYREGDMPHSIRVAIASRDGLHVDGQFSQCQEFYIYQVSAREWRLIAIRAAETAGPLKAEQKQNYRAEIIQDCQVLYSQSIGGPAAAKVIKQNVHPIKLNGSPLIVDIIGQLQHVLLTSPPPWLAKTMGMVRAPSNTSLQEDRK